MNPIVALVECSLLTAAFVASSITLGEEASRPAPHPAPHPWISEAPPAISRLIDIGQVSIVIDDQTVRAANRSALTYFDFLTQYELRYRSRPMPSDAEGNRQAKVSIQFLQPSLIIKHEIRLLSSYQPTKPWESRLLLHEMDHVAISTDPRLRKLLSLLEYAPRSWGVALPPLPNDDNDFLLKEIKKKTKERREAVQKVVHRYYDRLDSLSQNGLSDLRDRRDFFMTLYSTKDLETMEFPFVEDVRKSLDSMELKDIENHYLLNPSIRER